jgi:hypothetical protein
MQQTTRVVYHVLPADDGWVVEREQGGEMSRHRTKEEAEREAKRLAREQDLGQVIVHDAAGRFDYESTYCADPRRTPG